MKKIFAILLAAVIVLSLSVSAFAGVSSAAAPKSDTKATSDVPQIVEGTVKVISIDELSGEEAKAMESAVKSLPEALKSDELAAVIPEGTIVQYCCYATAENFPAEISFAIENASEAIVLAFINGKWVRIETTENEDGTFSVILDEAAPIAILTK